MTIKELAALIEISSVQSYHSKDDVLETAELCKKHGFAVAYSLPAYTRILADALKGCTTTVVGGNISFPYGAEKLQTKLYMAHQIIEDGAHDIDMVINIGDLKTGEYDKMFEEISAIKKVIGDRPLKTIFEVPYLTNAEVTKASEIALDAGADYIKTGTGWAPDPVTEEKIDLMLAVAKDRGHGKVKASGGVRGLDTLLRLYDKGVARFGIRDTASMEILAEARKRWGE